MAADEKASVATVAIYLCGSIPTSVPEGVIYNEG